MKNLPALIALTALAALVLLAVVSSVVDSVPFVLPATYIVSAACSLGLVGLFIGDYANRSPQLDLSPKKVQQAHFQPDPQEAREVAPLVPQDVLSTLGIRNDPATLSYS
jgi:hypothetical protein